jgi:hypothetical protein
VSPRPNVLLVRQNTLGSLLPGEQETSGDLDDVKTIACYALHYGLEYLPWSIRSVQDAVDEIHIFYAEKPSYGHTKNIPCPEHELELQTAAHRFLRKSLFWHVGSWQNEQEHREAFLEVAHELATELILVVDADELWPPGSARATLEHAYRENNAGQWFANFQNFWRSFKYEVRDNFKPIRILDLRQMQDIYSHLELGPQAQPEPVYHFGYAISKETMAYKWTCHGHQLDLATGWLEDKFLAWSPETNQPEELYPLGSKLWQKAHRTSEHVDEIIKSMLHDHPYYNLELIP